MEGLVEVRDSMKFDEASLTSYLGTHMNLPGPMQVRQFTYGQSNPTYLLIAGNGRKLVLRKKPHGKLLPKAHAVEREYAVLKALSSTDFPVPEVYLLCEDSSIIGTPFYIMEFMQGRIFHDPTMPGVDRATRCALYEELARVMALLHSYDVDTLGLSSWKRPGSYANRQANTWGKAYEASKTSQLPTMGEISRYLATDPEQRVPDCIVHGDFRLGNVMFHPTQNRIIAVLDWELASIGHPFADIAYQCMTYVMPVDNALSGGLEGVDFHKTGIPSHREFVVYYLKNAVDNGVENIAHGVDGDLDWEAEYRYYLVLSLFRSASIAQGVYKRSLQGNAASTKAQLAGEAAKVVAAIGAKIAQSTGTLLFGLSQYEKVPDSLMSFSSLLRPRFYDLRKRILAFTDAYIVPNHGLYFHQRARIGQWESPPIVEVLKTKAKSLGLWNLFLPESELGGGLTNLEYAPLCEIMGRIPYLTAEIFNCNAPDTGNMEVLERYGTEEQKAKWLTPLLNGEIRSCFAMTEPRVASSDASNIECSIVRDGDEYVINGRKWWTSGILDTRCKIAILMGKTDPTASKYRQQSMILVPVDTPGFRVLRSLSVFGFDDAPHGHGECDLKNVRVPVSNILLGEGRGFEISQGRLGPGRIHHCMRSVGIAEYALELLCKRVQLRYGFNSRFSDKDTILRDIAESRMDIEQARLLTLQAAHMMDTEGNKVARQHIAMIKVVAPQVALRVLDRSIQAHGGAGVSQDFPLAGLWCHARTLRLADGPDDVHRRTIARIELAHSKL